MKRQAVIHVAEAFGGGLFETLRDLANHSASVGVNTVVIHGVRPETPADPSDSFHPGVRLVRVDGWGQRRPKDVLRFGLRAATTLRHEVRRYDGGIIHFHSSLAGLVGRLMPPFGKGWNVFYSPHGYAFVNPLYGRRFRVLAVAVEAALGRRGRTIAVSHAEGAIGVRLLGQHRVTAIRLGVEAMNVPDPEPGAAITVMAYGRAVSTRRPEEFAALAKSLREEELAFVWAGDGPGRDVLERAGVSVLGWRSQEDARTALANAHMVIHLSALEGLPRAVLDAMAAGRPVIATDLAPIREVIGNTGVLVRDEAETVAAVMRLAEDRSLRAELGSRARKRVERHFSVEQMARRWMAAYGLDGAS
jgi:glycosyltransferase involved in cell wall biosynthesis